MVCACLGPDLASWQLSADLFLGFVCCVLPTAAGVDFLASVLLLLPMPPRADSRLYLIFVFVFWPACLQLRILGCCCPTLSTLALLIELCSAVILVFLGFCSCFPSAFRSSFCGIYVCNFCVFRGFSAAYSTRTYIPLCFPRFDSSPSVFVSVSSRSNLLSATAVFLHVGYSVHADSRPLGGRSTRFFLDFTYFSTSVD